MIDNLIKESIVFQERGFYSQDFYFSYSSISKLMYNPVLFYAIYVLGLKTEKRENYLVEGKLMHAMLLLSPEEVEKQFLVERSVSITPNVKKILDSCYKKIIKYNGVTDELENYEELLLEEMFQQDYFQNLKTDKQRIEKVITKESKDYWNFNRLKDGKILVSLEQFEKCRQGVEIMKDNDKVRKLLGLEGGNIEVMNEVELKSTNNLMDIFPFGIKGILDNLVINHDEKKIYLNDIKTTGKTLKDFKESIELYQYWLQITIYLFLVHLSFSSLINSGYKVEVHFIVLDCNQHCYPFKVSDETIINWTERTIDTLKKVNYHYSKNEYYLPYDYSVGSIIL